METYRQIVERFGSVGLEVMLVASELRTGPDRGAALLGQSLVENALRLAIRLAMPAKFKHIKPLIGDGESAGVLGFSDQVRLAYGLGIISEDSLYDLLIIAKIRNRFGHSPEPMRFEDKRIKDRCLALKNVNTRPYGGGSPEATARDRYVCCVSHYYRTLGAACQELVKGWEDCSASEETNPIAPVTQAAPQASPPTTEPPAEA